MGKSFWPKLVTFALFFGVFFTGVANYQVILDQVALWQYEPAPEIASLADGAMMSDQGRRTYYLSRPELQEKEPFNSSCPTREETIVLGCFTGMRIYILKVGDQRLEGVEEVTAAHEMLHAAYQRLQASEKSELESLLQTALKAQNSQRLNETIESYRKKDPSVVPNELHSILGTEVSSLGPELEAYYQQYFTNRGALVALSQEYQQVFDDLEKQVADYDVQLQSIKTRIDAQETNLAIVYRQIEAEKTRLDGLLANNQINTYNAGVASFNALGNR